MPVSRFDCPPPGRAEQITTRIAYLILGVGVSSWAALVPYAKTRLGLDEAVLGMLLLCVGVGSLLSMPFTGLISGRFGCRKVILVSGVIFLAMLPLLASVESIWLMALCLFLFGASIGMMDVSLTIQAVFVEQAAGRAMMSGFHCLYSVGGICGAGGMALLLGFLAPHLAMLVICLFMIALLAAFGRHFLPYGSEGETPLFVVPRGIVLLIGVLCFIMYLSEGTILDWGALFMTAERGTEACQIVLIRIIRMRTTLAMAFDVRSGGPLSPECFSHAGICLFSNRGEHVRYRKDVVPPLRVYPERNQPVCALVPEAGPVIPAVPDP